MKAAAYMALDLGVAVMTKPSDPSGISKRLYGNDKGPNGPLNYEIFRDEDGEVLGYTHRLGAHGFEVKRYGSNEWFHVRADAPHTSAMYWLDRDPSFSVEDGYIVKSSQDVESFIRSPDELSGDNGDEHEYPEGACEQKMVNRYERDPKAREECLKYWGYQYRCAVCDFSFKERYGSLGHKYINVHHLVELSQAPPDYKVNPKKDLVPLCPNCHAMIHRPGVGYALTVEELKQQLRPTKQ